MAKDMLDGIEAVLFDLDGTLVDSFGSGMRLTLNILEDSVLRFLPDFRRISEA